MEIQEYLELQREFMLKVGGKITLNHNPNLICNICNAKLLRGQIVGLMLNYPKNNYVCIKHTIRDFNKEIKNFENTIQELKTQQENTKKIMQIIEDYNTMVRL